MRWRFLVSATLVAASSVLWPVPTSGVGRPASHLSHARSKRGSQPILRLTRFQREACFGQRRRHLPRRDPRSLEWRTDAQRARLYDQCRAARVGA